MQRPRCHAHFSIAGEVSHLTVVSGAWHKPRKRGAGPKPWIGYDDITGIV